MSHISNFDSHQQKILIELFQKLIDEGSLVLDLSEAVRARKTPKPTMSDFGLTVKDGKVTAEPVVVDPKSKVLDNSTTTPPSANLPPNSGATMAGSSSIRPSGLTPPAPKKSSTAKNIAGGVAGGAVIGAGVSALSGDDAPTASAKPSTSNNVNFLDPTPIAKQKVDLKPTPADQIPSDVVLGGPTKLPSDVKSVPMAPKSAAKPAAKPAPAQKPAASPEAPAPKNDNPYGYARSGSDEDTAANFFTAAAKQHKAETGKTAPNDFSDSGIGKAIENSAANKWMNKTFGGQKVSESTLINSLLKMDSNKNMFSEAKKAKKDWDKDGKVESEKDEVWGSRFAAAKKAGKMEEATSSDPDFAAPRPDGTKKPDDIQYKPEDKKPEDKTPLPPKRPSGLKEAYLKILKGE